MSGSLLAIQHLKLLSVLRRWITTSKAAMVTITLQQASARTHLKAAKVTTQLKVAMARTRSKAAKEPIISLGVLERIAIFTALPAKRFKQLHKLTSLLTLMSLRMFLNFLRQLLVISALL